MSGLLRTITGATDEEIPQVFFSFLALTVLLMSYYLLKPLRTSFFLKEFDPEWIPRIYLLLPIFSLLLTRFYNVLYRRLEKRPLVVCTYSLVIAAKLVFFVILPKGTQGVILAFYFFSTAYFLLVMSVMWACLSAIFDSLSGERTFAFISFGGMVGAAAGSKVSSELGESSYKDYALLASAFLMGLALVFLMIAIRNSKSRSKKKAPEERPDRSWISDFREIWNHRYLRSIALMVFALGFMNTVLDFVSSRVIDERLALQEYRSHFDGTLPAEGFDFVYSLKELPEESRLSEGAEWLSSHKVQMEPSAFLKEYESFRDTQEGKVRVFYSQVNYYQSLLGMFIMLLIARLLFQFVGVRKLLVLLPAFFMITGFCLLFPLELGWVFFFLVTSGTLNYSLNKTSKELLYTETDNQVRFRFKPLIGGPLRRFGDVGAALIKVACSDLLGFTKHVSEAIPLLIGLPLTIWWLLSVYATGRDYEIRQAERKKQLSDPNSQ